MTKPAPITRIGAQHAAHHELSKSLYHRNDDPLVVRATRWIGHIIDRGLSAGLNHAPTGALGALSLIVVVGVILAVVIWRVGVPRSAATAGAVLPAGRAVSAAEHRELAVAAAERGDWHDAVIERMRAIARECEERSILEPRAGRTATELAREAATVVPVAGPDLRKAAEVFNDIAYGGGAGDPTHLDVMIAADEAVRAGARSKVLAQ